MVRESYDRLPNMFRLRQCHGTSCDVCLEVALAMVNRFFLREQRRQGFNFQKCFYNPSKVALPELRSYLDDVVITGKYHPIQHSILSSDVAHNFM